MFWERFTNSIQFISRTWRNLVVGDLSRKVSTIFQAESIVFVNCCVCPFCQVAFSCFARSSAFKSFPSIIAKIKQEAISRFSGLHVCHRICPCCNPVIGEIMKINNTPEMRVWLVSDVKLEYNIRIGITPTFLSTSR